MSDNIETPSNNIKPTGIEEWHDFFPLNERGSLDRVEGNGHRNALKALAKAAVRESHLEEKLGRDPLTGLYEKSVFIDKLTRDIEADNPIALLFIDLDKFSEVNKRLTHTTGDQILKSFAGYLNDKVRSDTDTLGYGKPDDSDYLISRFGGDEFWVKINLRPRQAAPNGVEEINNDAPELVKARIIADLDQFIESLPSAETLREIGFGVSIGAVIPTEGEDWEDLVGRASKSMYRHKESRSSQRVG